MVQFLYYIFIHYKRKKKHNTNNIFDNIIKYEDICVLTILFIILVKKKSKKKSLSLWRGYNNKRKRFQLK